MSPEFCEDALASDSRRATAMNCGTAHNGAPGCNGTVQGGNSRRRYTHSTWRALLLANLRTHLKSPGEKIANAGKRLRQLKGSPASDRRHAATVDIWDADPWLLNTPGGIVDLHTGKMLPHDPGRYITKITAVAPGGSLSALAGISGEITGETRNFKLPAADRRLLPDRQHERACAVLLLWTGGNGKGVFLNTLAAILADYAAVAPMETFIATQNDRHPTDLAGLRGARLVTSQETEEGRRWAEARSRR